MSGEKKLLLDSADNCKESWFIGPAPLSAQVSACLLPSSLPTRSLPGGTLPQLTLDLSYINLHKSLLMEDRISVFLNF